MKMIRAVILVGAVGLLGCGQEQEVASTETPTTTTTTAPQSDFASDAWSDEAFATVAADQAEAAAWYAAVAEEEARRVAAAEAAERAERDRQRREEREVTAASSSEPVIVEVASGDVWERLAQCESGMTNANTGNGYYGYFQFLPSTWHSVGGTGLPTDHGYGEQVHRAQILQARSGWGQWPACSRQLGLR